MPAANVSYFKNLWNREKGSLQAMKDILCGRNRPHEHGYVPGRP
jgi:hypothetical protein